MSFYLRQIFWLTANYDIKVTVLIMELYVFSSFRTSSHRTVLCRRHKDGLFLLYIAPQNCNNIVISEQFSMSLFFTERKRHPSIYGAPTPTSPYALSLFIFFRSRSVLLLKNYIFFKNNTENSESSFFSCTSLVFQRYESERTTLI